MMKAIGMKHKRGAGRSASCALATVTGLVFGASFFAPTPTNAQGRDIRDTVREAKEPRKTVKLPTRPNSHQVHAPTRPIRDHAGHVPARPGKQTGDRAQARPGHEQHAEPRIRDFRDKRPQRH